MNNAAHILNVLGLASFIFVAAFTYHAYNKESTIGQSPKSAIIEAWINIIIGFSINYGANWLILPLVGANFTSMENFAMGWIYTAISVVRTYAIRRWFNQRLHEASVRMAQALDRK